MINKIKPYIIYTAVNKYELEKIQIDLFSKGYKWLNGSKLDVEFIYLMTSPFPMYISNLPYLKVKDVEDILKNRISYNEYDNNILYLSTIKSDFNLKLLRIDKLITLKNNED